MTTHDLIYYFVGNFISTAVFILGREKEQSSDFGNMVLMLFTALPMLVVAVLADMVEALKRV